MTEPRVRVARWVRYYRTEEGLSQEGLARRANVSFTTINKVELGKSDATVETLEKIARALDVSVMDLLSSSMPSSRTARRTGNGYSRQTPFDLQQLIESWGPLDRNRLGIPA